MYSFKTVTLKYFKPVYVLPYLTSLSFFFFFFETFNVFVYFINLQTRNSAICGENIAILKIKNRNKECFSSQIIMINWNANNTS